MFNLKKYTIIICILFTTLFLPFIHVFQINNSFMRSRYNTPLFHTATTTEDLKIAKTAVTFTSKAIEKLNIMHDKNKNKKCFRVGIKDGGCSGMSYVIEPMSANDILEEDRVEVHEDITCAIDKFSLLYIDGMLIDYQSDIRQDGEQPGFVFKNPIASSSCDCGVSFRV